MVCKLCFLEYFGLVVMRLQCTSETISKNGISFISFIIRFSKNINIIKLFKQNNDDLYQITARPRSSLLKMIGCLPSYFFPNQLWRTVPRKDWHTENTHAATNKSDSVQTYLPKKYSSKRLV